MNIKKKLQIVDILFRTLEKDEEIADEHIEQVLASMVQNPLKREKYKQNMIEKYGKDIFEKRSKKAAAIRDKKRRTNNDCKTANRLT